MCDRPPGRTLTGGGSGDLLLVRVNISCGGPQDCESEVEPFASPSSRGPGNGGKCRMAEATVQVVFGWLVSTERMADRRS